MAPLSSLEQPLFPCLVAFAILKIVRVSVELYITDVLGRILSNLLKFCFLWSLWLKVLLKISVHFIELWVGTAEDGKQVTRTSWSAIIKNSTPTWYSLSSSRWVAMKNKIFLVCRGLKPTLSEGHIEATVGFIGHLLRPQSSNWSFAETHANTIFVAERHSRCLSGVGVQHIQFFHEIFAFFWQKIMN